MKLLMKTSQILIDGMYHTYKIKKSCYFALPTYLELPRLDNVVSVGFLFSAAFIFYFG